MTKYSLIYADPAWKYDDKAQAGNRGAEFKYKCLDTSELIEMARYVDSVVADNAVMYMWTTAPMMPDALNLLGYWGFDYKTVAFVWIKTNKNPLHKDGPLLCAGYDRYGGIDVAGDFMGMGNHTRGNAEFVLLGVRCKGIKRIRDDIRQVIISPRQEHSRKPVEVRKRLELMYGDVTRLEMFARETTPGWAIHGDEIDKFKSL